MMATWSSTGEGVGAIDLDALYRSQQLAMTRLAQAIVGSNPVAEEIVQRLPATALLTGVSMLMAVVASGNYGPRVGRRPS